MAMVEELRTLAASSPPEAFRAAAAGGPAAASVAARLAVPSVAVTLALACPDTSRPRIGRLTVTVYAWRNSDRRHRSPFLVRFATGLHLCLCQVLASADDLCM